MTPEMARELLEAAADDGKVLGKDPETGPRDRRQGGPLRALRHRGASEDDEADRQAEGPRRPPRPSRAPPRSSRTWSSRHRRRSTTRCKLLSLPRVVGTDAEGVEITAQNGRYGPYLKKGTDSRSLDDRAAALRRSRSRRRSRSTRSRSSAARAAAPPPLKELGTDPVSGKPIVVKDGRFGPYVTDGETNATLRKDDDPEAITPERGYELLAEKRAKGPTTRKRAVKKTAKKTAKKTTARTTKKATAKKA